MKTPFSILDKEVMPKVNIQVANALKDELTQAKIAEFLGVSQVQVSKYLKENIELDDELKEFADTITASIKEGKERREIVNSSTSMALSLIQKGYFAKYDKEFDFSNYNLLAELKTDKKAKVIENIKQAIKLIEKENPIELMPEVRMNIAMSINSPVSEKDVAAIPGRFTIINGKIKASSEPSFNASRHLADLLLKIKKLNPEINAIADIKKTETENSILFDGKNVDSIDKNTEFLVMLADYGIEPVTYVIGKSAIDVANKIIKLKYRKTKDE